MAYKKGTERIVTESMGSVPDSVLNKILQVRDLLASKNDALSQLFTDEEHLKIERLEIEAAQEGFVISWILALGIKTDGELGITSYAEAVPVREDLREFLKKAADLDIAELDKIEGSSK